MITTQTQAKPETKGVVITGKKLPQPEPKEHNFGTKTTLLVNDRDLFLSDDPVEFNRFMNMMERETVKWEKRKVQTRSGSPSDDPESRLLLWKVKAKDTETGKTVWDNQGSKIAFGNEQTDIPSKEKMLEMIQQKKGIKIKDVTGFKSAIKGTKDVNFTLTPVVEEKKLAKIDRKGNPVYWKKGKWYDRTIWMKNVVTDPVSGKEIPIKSVIPEWVDVKGLEKHPDLMDSFKTFLSRRNRRINMTDTVSENQDIKKIEETAPFICALDSPPKIRLMGPVDLMRPLTKAVVALIDGDMETLNKIIDERKNRGRLNDFPYYLPRIENENDERDGMLSSSAVSLSRLFVNKAERDPDGKFCSDTIRVYINPERAEGKAERKLMSSLKKENLVKIEEAAAEEEKEE